jgi:hypothetical protein
MNVDDRKMSAGMHGRGGGVAGRASRSRRGRRPGRTALQSSWFGSAFDQDPIVTDVDVDDNVDDGMNNSDDERDEKDAPSAVDDEPQVYRGGLRRKRTHKIDVSTVSFPCVNKTDLLGFMFQAKARLSRRQLDLFILFVNDPWVRQSGSSYETGKQMLDDAPRLFPMMVPVYVKTTVTKVVAKTGTANRQLGEKRTVTKNVRIKQYRVPDIVERGLGNPVRGQHYKLGVKNSPAQIDHTINQGATEYRESEHAMMMASRHCQYRRTTRTGSFEVGPYIKLHVH